MKVTSKSLVETQEIAQNFLQSLSTKREAQVVALYGELGAGKTAFTQAVGKLLGITENMQSPTFVIMKVYAIAFKGFTRLIHIDAYRLEQEAELLHLGWAELVKEPENLIMIEWPERVANLIPFEARHLKFSHVSESVREIEIS